VAADLRRTLGADVEMIHGRYGEFKVLVDGDVVVDAGALAMIGVLPTKRQVRATVRDRLRDPPPRVGQR